MEKENNSGIDRTRVISFSDAIFAFAITLLVLKIDLPALEQARLSEQLPGALIALWPQYLANILSFIIIGNYWVIHHKIFNVITKIDVPLLWINVFLLMVIAFLPFPTEQLGDYGDQPSIVVFYLSHLAIIGVLQLVLWLYASNKHRLIDKSVPNSLIRYYTIRSIIPAVVFLVCIPIAYLSDGVANYFWVLLLLIPISSFIRPRHT